MNTRSPLRARVLAGSLLLAAIGTVAAVPIASASPLSSASPISAARPGQPASGTPAPGVVSWSVEPATAKAPDSRTRFTYQSIKPGSLIFDHVAVFNRSKQAVAFSIYATDASGTSANGALTLLQTGQKSTAIGAWTTFPGHVSQLSIIIPADKGVIEPFTITVPRLATPGDHIGGMIAAVGVPHRTSTGQMVTVYQRIAVPMELRVTGKLIAALAVKSVSVGFGTPFNPFGGGSAHVTYSIVNTGNVMLAGLQTVTVTGPFGAKSTLRVPKLPVVLPGDSIPYTVSAGGLYPAGSLTAHVTVTPGWPADATPLPVTLTAASASASLFAVPWALIVLIIVLAVGGYFLLRLRRARRRAREAEIAAVADRARRETERRLLGSGAGKSSAQAAPNGKPPARPARTTTAKPPRTATTPATKPAPAAAPAEANPAADAASTTGPATGEPAESAAAPTGSPNGTGQHE
jgi:hypothetical protein